MTKAWVSFHDRLVADLDGIGRDLVALLDISTIRYVNPNTRDSSVFFVGAADWGWGPSDDEQRRARIALSQAYSSWWARFQTLFDGIPPETKEAVKAESAFLVRWIDRGDGWDHAIPQTIPEAKKVAMTRLAVLRDAVRLLGGHGANKLIVVPDTSALVDAPDLAWYADAVESKTFTVHLLPKVISELDDLKDTAKTQEIRDRARGVIRRIKGLRDHGNLTGGVNLTRTIRVVAETHEPEFSRLPGWLNPDVPDDRIIAGALEVQARHPSSVVVFVASDLNIQNKAEVAGIPYVEPPSRPRETKG
jgi:hypothetical protein